MKIKIFILAILTVALGAMNASAQNETDDNNKLHAPDGLFNHLSIGVHTGLAGSGIDVTMPVHRLITVRAGYSGLHFGDIKFKAINTAEDLAGYALVEDDAVRRSQMVDKIELAAKPNTPMMAPSVSSTTPTTRFRTTTAPSTPTSAP